MAVAADVGDPQRVTRLVDRVTAELGRVEILVNNAAVVWPLGPTSIDRTATARGQYGRRGRVCEHLAMADHKTGRFDELPIACTLGPTDGAARLARWRALSHARLTVQRTPDQLVVLYRPQPGIYEELGALVASERECCSFAEWELTRNTEHVVLRIRSDATGLATILDGFG